MSIEEFGRLLGALAVGLLAGSALGYYTAWADKRRDDREQG